MPSITREICLGHIFPNNFEQSRAKLLPLSVTGSPECIISSRLILTEYTRSQEELQFATSELVAQQIRSEAGTKLSPQELETLSAERPVNINKHQRVLILPTSNE
jgi:hypothetical protein